MGGAEYSGASRGSSNQKTDPAAASRRSDSSAGSSPIDPPISSTRCLEIARPSPVPPVLLACTRSPWKKGVNSRSRVDSGMPGPVSATSKRIRGPAWEPIRRRLRVIPPSRVNFTGVLEKVDDDLPQPPRIAANEGGERIIDVDDDLETLPVRLHREEVDGLVHPGAEIEVRRLELESSRLDLSKSRVCR